MSQKDRVNQKINNYHIYLASLLAGFLGLIGFIFTSFDKSENWLIVLACVTCVCVMVLIALLQVKINKANDELGGL